MQATSTKKRTALWLCVTALFMALNVVMSSFGVPVPGGHLYMNDIIICTAAMLLDPLAAFMVGGVGAFLGDLLPSKISFAWLPCSAINAVIFLRNFIKFPILSC